MNRYVVKGDLLWPQGHIRPGVLIVEGTQIGSVKEKGEPLQDSTIIEVPPGGVVAPGFIDLQINGAFGHDFTNHPRQITAVARTLPRFGVTAFLPTLVTAPLERYLAAISAAKEIKTEPEAALMLGLHFEGPYLNPTKAGAHPIQYLRRPSLDETLYFDPSVVKMITLAPELPGAISFIRALIERGIRVGIGHSVASYEQTMAAAAAGVCWGTHLFNAMGTLHHRHPGIVGALLADDRLRLALLADGVHVHPALLRTVVAAKGAANVTLISDSIAATGMPEGEYTLGDQKVVVDSASVRLANGTLAGSRITLDQAVRHMVSLAGRPVHEALQMASTTPAEVVGVKGKGKLAAGFDADLTVLDEDLQVILTMIRGRIVYQATT